MPKEPQRGVDLLEIDSQLDQAADLHTNEMVQADQLSNPTSWRSLVRRVASVRQVSNGKDYGKVQQQDLKIPKH